VLSNRSNGKPKPEPSSEGKQLQRDPRAALDVLRKNGIKILYHFTDESNVQSIRAHGLMSASTLLTKSISSVMNSDEASRQLDIKAGLQNYVRLSFCAKNPMMYVSLNEGRISKPVMLQIKLDALHRPGVLFSDCNATRLGASIKEDPSVVRFDVVKAKTQFDVAEPLRQFYQAEALVPSPIPPDLIIFPDRPLSLRRRRASEQKKAETASSLAPPTPAPATPPVLSDPVICRIHPSAYDHLLLPPSQVQICG